MPRQMPKSKVHRATATRRVGSITLDVDSHPEALLDPPLASEASL